MSVVKLGKKQHLLAKVNSECRPQEEAYKRDIFLSQAPQNEGDGKFNTLDTSVQVMRLLSKRPSVKKKIFYLMIPENKVKLIISNIIYKSFKNLIEKMLQIV